MEGRSFVSSPPLWAHLGAAPIGALTPTPVYRRTEEDEAGWRRDVIALVLIQFFCFFLFCFKFDAMAKQYDVLFRLLLLGDSGVGKTCLLCRFTDNEFHPSHISTIGVDFKMKTLMIDGIKVRIQIWDTAGQERYQTITKQYYRRAQGIFLVYDITSERSFQHIMKWASDVEEYAPEKVQKILVGNKSDEEQKRQVATEQGNKLAKAYGMDFYETSAFTNHNIKESFTRLAELVLQANKKDLEVLRTSINDDLNIAALEEEEGMYDNHGDSQKACWC
uniref:Ras-related protein Rab-15 n=2 Tax=Denticeps clupeoides TaxID=299321 RepID=A0AAY4BVX7_9TELE